MTFFPVDHLVVVPMDWRSSLLFNLWILVVLFDREGGVGVGDGVSS